MAERVFSEKLTKVLNEIKSKVGESVIIDKNDNSLKVNIACSTGSKGLDIMLGGGYYEARMLQIIGPESSGKTTLCFHAIKEMQKKGKICAYFDMEASLSLEYMESIGINTDKLILSQPDCGEECLDAAQMLCDSGEVSLICIDSVPSLVGRNAIEAESGEFKVALTARLVTQALLKLVPSAKRNKCTIIWINQLRDNVGNIYGPAETVPGGRALKFYSSLILDVRRISKNEGDMENGEKGFISNTVRVKSIKNKCFPPFRETELTIVYGKGISIDSEYASAALKANILCKTNSGICFTEETPLFPKDTAISTSLPKLVQLLSEVNDDKENPYYWVKREIELRTDLFLKQISEEEVDKELSPIYEKKEKENKYAQQYLDLASKASSSSKLVEAYIYINKAYKYNPFDKNIISKFKQINKRYQEKSFSFKEEDFIVEVVSVEKNEELIKVDSRTLEE